MLVKEWDVNNASPLFSSWYMVSSLLGCNTTAAFPVKVTSFSQLYVMKCFALSSPPTWFLLPYEIGNRVTHLHLECTIAEFNYGLLKQIQKAIQSWLDVSVCSWILPSSHG